MSTITVLRPDESTPPAATITLAPRTELPERPTIGLISNGKPFAKELLGALATEFSLRLGREVDIERLAKPSAAYVITPEEADAMAARADIVICGLGDCGSCSSCSMHDAVLLEQRGTPATVLITEPFQTVVAANAAKLGAPGYHNLTVPHPVWGKDEDGMRELARTVLSRAFAQLAPSPVELSSAASR